MGYTVIRHFLFFLLALPFAGATQDLTGIWRGYFITEMGEQYKLEFQVQQSKTQTVKGVSYSYLDTRFYGKASMTGNFVKTNKGFNIQELRTVEVRNLGGGGTCLMNYKFTYVKSGKEEFLEGTYIGRTENKQDPKKNGKWGDCGGGTVFLRKVPTSDFYVEPFLRNPPIVRKTVTPKKPATSSKKPATPPKVQNTKKPAEGNKQDSVIRLGTPEPIRVEKQAAKKIFVPEFTRSRSNDLVQTINVKHEEIIIKLFDNGEVDNDTVSLYLNGNLVLANQRLSTVPIVYKLSLSEDAPEQTLIMVAENMGWIPPNTSLMIVEDGKNRYRVNITSTDQKNGMVRFRLQKSPD